MKNEELFSLLCSFGLFIKEKESLNKNKKAPKCEHSGASMLFYLFTFLPFHVYSSSVRVADDVDAFFYFYYFPFAVRQGCR